MNYERKYKEALERAREQYNKRTPLYDIESIFPELAENEDERIRKELIENFKWFCGDYPETTKWGKDYDLLVKDIIAWLEKQDEQTHAKLGQSEVTKTSDQELSDNIDVRTMTAWQSGYNEAIDKACEWLENDFEELTRLHLDDIVIDKFRKAMKGGEK